MSFMHSNWAKLVKGMTLAELSLEIEIAKLGFPYRVQHPFFLWHSRRLPFFPDFYVMRPGSPFIIEVDDPDHDKPEKKKRDAVRTQRIWEVERIPVVRVTNAEVHADPAAALAKALEKLDV